MIAYSQKNFQKKKVFEGNLEIESKILKNKNWIVTQTKVCLFYQRRNTKKKTCLGIKINILLETKTLNIFTCYVKKKHPTSSTTKNVVL